MVGATKNRLITRPSSLQPVLPSGLRTASILFVILAACSGTLLRGVNAATNSGHCVLSGRDSHWERNQLQGEQEIVGLELGKTLTLQLASGKSHTYQVTLAANQYLHMVVDQQGVNVDISIISPDGQKLADMDSPFGSFGPETVSIVSAVSGVFSIKVHSLSQGGSGTYQIRIGALRDPTPADMGRITAERIFMQAKEMRPTGDEPALIQKTRDAQIAKYKEALPYWREAGDSYGQAKTLYSIGDLYQSIGKTVEAADNFFQSTAILETLEYPRALAIAHNSLGRSLGQSGYLTRAAENLKLALTYWESQNDPAGVANILNNLGVTYCNLGEPQQALGYHDRALKIRQELDRKRDIAQSLINIGLVFDRSGEWQKGFEQYSQALSLLRSIQEATANDRSNEASALNNIGYGYASLGDPQTALDYFTESLAIRKTLNRPREEGASLSNIGNAHFLMGNLGDALAYCNNALPKLNNWGAAYNLINLGNIYRSMGNSQAALEHYGQALTALSSTDDRQGQAAAFNGIGTTYAGLNNTEKATENFDKALALWRASQDQQGEATALLGLARLARDRKSPTDALQLLDNAIKILESNRAKLTSWELRSSYFVSAHDYYDLAIELRMNLHKQFPTQQHNVVGLQLSEQKRARTLFDMLSEANVVAELEIPPEFKQRKRELESRISAKAASQLQLARDRANNPERAAAEKEIRGLLNEYEQMDARVRDSNPHYAALTKPRPATVEEIQTQLLDSQTLLIEYALGEERSYAWVVSRNSVESYELPGKKEIETEAMRFYELMTAREPVPRESTAQFQKRVSESDALFPAQAMKLSNLILGPLAGRLGQKRLLIVSEGGMQMIPFCALPEPPLQPAPAGAVKAARGRGPGVLYDQLPLIYNHEIIPLPSVSVLAALRRETAGRRPAPKQVAVLANPVFDKNDQRVKSTNKEVPYSAKRAAKADGWTRVLRDFDSSFPPLPSTLDEAEAIMSVAAAGRRMKLDAFKASGQGKTAVDFSASRDMAMSPEIKQYRIVHFATHGLVNDRHPALSGVVLTLVDERGEPQDGFLSLHDIFNLSLPADLVVLSACRTGLGKETKGEGIIGLTRGFMYAGAARVMTTLWSINDFTTARFMKSFYEQMLLKGLSPAEALRRVQIERLERSAWKHPYYWAAFVLTGDYK